MLIEISSSLGLLLGFSLFKAVILILLSVNLFNQWKQQKVRYWTDFPVLMGFFFSIYSISKIFDIFLYYYMRNESGSGNIFESTLLYGQFLARTLFFLVYLFFAPYVVLMLIIWFNDKKKAKIGIFIGWSFISFLGILISKNYSQLLTTGFIISLIPILTSIVTYLIMHFKKKMGTINNLLLACGWSLVFITQMIRPIWQNMGDSIWGASWVAEIIETFPYIMIWYGFNNPSRYYSKRNKEQEAQFSENLMIDA